MKVPLRSN